MDYSNVTPAEIMNKLDAGIQALTKGNEELKMAGQLMAESKGKYAIALRKEILRLQTDGAKATYILELAKGEENVARLRYKKDIAENNYYTTKDAQAILKSEIDSLRSILSYTKEEYKNA